MNGVFLPLPAVLLSGSAPIATPVCQPETFVGLLKSGPHWAFEVFLMVVFDGVVGLVLWPFVAEHWAHHVAHDEAHGSAKSKRGK